MRPNKYIKNIHLNSKRLVENELEQQKQNQSQIQLKEFNFAAKPYQNFEVIDLKQITSIKISDTGSRGVYFLDSIEGSIVLKLSGQVAVEIFLNKLAHNLGIKTTKMKQLKWNDIEMQELKNQILYAASNDEVLLYRLKQKLKVVHFEMIEYIPGIQMHFFQGERAKFIFTDERLTNLGKIIGFDIFINNGDRFPLPIWRSIGNAYNVILRIDDTAQEDLFNLQKIELNYGDLYSIDPQTVLYQIDQTVQVNILNQYKDKVKDLLNGLCDDLKTKNTIRMRKFQDFIQEQTQYQLSNKQLLIIIQGILQQIKVIQNFGIENILKIKQEIICQDGEDWMNVNTNSTNSIHTQFYFEMIELFKEIINKNEETFKDF